jgi:hypothetical protein
MANGVYVPPKRLHTLLPGADAASPSCFCAIFSRVYPVSPNQMSEIGRRMESYTKKICFQLKRICTDK